jgi:hypothetical protein
MGESTMGNFLQDATRGRLKLLQGMEMALNPDAGLLSGAFRAQPSCPVHAVIEPL